jgi:DNA adenine methylase
MSCGGGVSKKTVKSPIPWYGGKGLIKNKIIPYFPAHHTYCEVFGGGGSILLAKKPAPVEVYNDINGALVNFFTTLQDHENIKKLQDKLYLTPYSREVWRRALNEYKYFGDPGTPLERAYRFFILVNMSFSGAGAGGYNASFSSSVKTTRCGKASTVFKYHSSIAGLPEVSNRLLDVQIERAHFGVVIDRYDTPDTLFYLDPPYLHSERGKNKNAYGPFEMDDSQHLRLIELVKKIEGFAVLSGYKSEIYESLCENHNWSRIDIEAVARTKYPKTGQPAADSYRTECLYLNPKTVSALSKKPDSPTNQPEQQVIFN